jgi:hypothetical protein
LAAITAAALLIVAVTGACGGDRSGGPKGDPQQVVGSAPDATVRQQSASVAVDTPSAKSSGTVRFPLTEDVKVEGVDPAPEVVHPLDAIDYVRGAVDIVPYGGAEVRGASTIRYSFEVDLDVAAAHAPTPERRRELELEKQALGRPGFYADVWIDSQGRVRRVQVPVDKHDKRPAYRAVVLERLVTVDFWGFNGEKEQR